MDHYQSTISQSAEQSGRAVPRGIDATAAKNAPIDAISCFSHFSPFPRFGACARQCGRRGTTRCPVVYDRRKVVGSAGGSGGG